VHKRHATKLYETAIAGFQKGELFLMEAVAYERFALAQQPAGLSEKSKENLRTSVTLFEEYGATLKVQHMRGCYSGVMLGS